MAVHIHEANKPNYAQSALPTSDALLLMQFHEAHQIKEGERKIRAAARGRKE